MLLKQMKYFVAVVECQSFTEAAEQCFISQSAISQQIHSLEDDMNTQLIIRENRRFKLTPSGEYFYRQCLGILDEIDKVVVRTKQLGEDDEQRLRIGIINQFSNPLLTTGIRQFREIYPEVEIEIKTGTHEEIYDFLRFEQLDMILNDHRRAFSEFYVNYFLTSSPCNVILSPLNPLSKLDTVSIDDLKYYPCIIIASQNQKNHELKFYQNTLGYGGQYLFAKDLNEAKLMVAGNLGFLPIEGDPLFKLDTNIISIPLYNNRTQIYRDYYLFWKKEKTNYYIEEFAQILHENFMKEQLISLF